MFSKNQAIEDAERSRPSAPPLPPPRRRPPVPSQFDQQHHSSPRSQQLQPPHDFRHSPSRNVGGGSEDWNQANTQILAAYQLPRRKPTQILRSLCSVLLWCTTVLVAATYLPRYVDMRTLPGLLQEAVRTHVLGILPPVVVLDGPNQISASEIGRILRHQYGDVEVFATDASYELPSEEVVAEFLADDDTDTLLYQTERFDCL